MPAQHVKTADRYAVVGNPIAHSKSPLIHAAFAAATQQNLVYEKLLAPLDGFVTTVESFRAQGGKGLNVTVPFKLEAFAYATQLTPRAQQAGAVNTLSFLVNGEVRGDNTDGAGLVQDLQNRWQTPLTGQRILLLGAGGAARGALLPLLQMQPAQLTLANRTVAKAQALCTHFQTLSNVPLQACGFNEIAGEFDVVINATASSLQDDVPPLPAGCFASHALAYDMMYSAQPTPFMQAALAQGAAKAVDGLGMLVEQAAEAFYVWRGIRPDTARVYAQLR